MWRWSNVPAHVTARVERSQRCFFFPPEKETARRGREHLVESAQRARLYLVIRDSISTISTFIILAPIGAFII